MAPETTRVLTEVKVHSAPKQQLAVVAAAADRVKTVVVAAPEEEEDVPLRHLPAAAALLDKVIMAETGP